MWFAQLDCKTSVPLQRDSWILFLNWQKILFVSFGKNRTISLQLEKAILLRITNVWWVWSLFFCRLAAISTGTVVTPHTYRSCAGFASLISIMAYLLLKFLKFFHYFFLFFSTSTVGVRPLWFGLFYLFYPIRKFSWSEIDSTRAVGTWLKLCGLEDLHQRCKMPLEGQGAYSPRNFVDPAILFAFGFRFASFYENTMTITYIVMYLNVLIQCSSWSRERFSLPPQSVSDLH